MKSNSANCYLLVSSGKRIKMGKRDLRIENSTYEKLSVLHFNHRLTFYHHIPDLCKRAVFDSQLKYCPLIRMCHGRTNNKKIDRISERWLRIIYKDKQSPFKELHKKGRSVPFHERNVQMLATEIYQISDNISPQHMNEIFEIGQKHPYNLRQNSQFCRPLLKSVYHGTFFFYSLFNVDNEDIL